MTRWASARRRLAGLFVAAGAALLLSACESPDEYVVDSVDDAVDASPGDGVCETAEGSCTLRAAVQEANASPGPGRIVLDGEANYVLGLAGTDEDDAVSGDLDVDGDLHVEGGGATIDGGGLDRVLHLHSGQLTLSEVTVTGGAGVAEGAGIRVDGGSLSLAASVVTGNVATNPAGSARGGGIHQSGGTVTLLASTLSGNTASSTAGAPQGGAYHQSAGQAVISHSTFSGNVVSGTFFSSGASLHASGTVEVRWSTFGTGSAAAARGIDGAPGSAVTLRASVLDTGGRSCNGTVASAGWNVASDATCEFSSVGDRSSASSDLAPLADNGGPTRTRLPGAGSAARGAIPWGVAGICDGTEVADQRGVPVPEGLPCDVGAVQQPPAPTTFVVDTGADGADANIGDGICATAVGECTLRAAVQEANADPALDVIQLGSTVRAELTLAGFDDAAAVGDLDITGDLVIRGGGTVDANQLGSAFHLVGGPVVTLEGVVVTGGRWSTGGGLLVSDPAARLAVVDSTVEGNEATGTEYCGSAPDISYEECGDAGGGGGIWSAGALSVNRSLITGNAATGGNGCETTSNPWNPWPGPGGGVTGVICTWAAGGGIRATGPLDVVNSTIAHNTVAIGTGGALATAGDASVRLSTVVDNHVTTPHPIVAELTGSLASSDGYTLVDGLTVGGSLVGGTEVACVGADSTGWNVFTDSTCTPLASDRVQTVLDLDALGDNGGPTQSFLPYAGGAGVDIIPVGTPRLCDRTTPTDQRGVARPEGEACDAGAVEGSSDVPAGRRTFVVDDAADGPDVAPGDGECATSAGTCTLRAAVDESNAWQPYTDTIRIEQGVDPVLALAGSGEDANATGDLDVVDSVVIEGAGAVVDGGGLDRLLDVQSPDTRVTIRDLTLTGGSADLGGALRQRQGALVLERVHVDGNLATVGGGALLLEDGTTLVTDSVFDGNRTEHATGSARGGAIHQTGPNHLSVATSTFVGNVAASTAGAPEGGAVAQSSMAAELDVDRSTFDGNRASGTFYSTGGALSTRGTTTIRSSTIAGGSAAYGAGITRHTGATTLVASILDNGAKSCHGTVGSGGHNLWSDTSCNLRAAGDRGGLAPMLGPLADNGGGTPTRLPSAVSPASDWIPVGTPGLCDASTPPDQRGAARPAGAACDVGAVDIDGPGAPAPLHLVVDDAGDESDADRGDGVCATTAGTCTLRAAIDQANAWTTTDTIQIAAGVDPTITRAGSSDTNSVGDLDVLGDLVVEGGGATVATAVNDRVFDVHDARLELRDLTITGGRGVDRGAGIRATDGAHLVIERTTVEGNQTGFQGKGGGIAALSSSVEITDSTVSRNSSQEGGGLHLDVASSTSAVVVRSTFSDNTATQMGGGIDNLGTLTIVDSTLSGNASPSGHAIRKWGATEIVRTTIVDGPTSGGRALHVQAWGGDLRLSGSVITGAGCSITSGAAPVSGGHNVTGDATCGLADATDVQASALLLPLADNGGPTATHLPLGGSPVLDRIPVGTPGLCEDSSQVDQRGEPRPAGIACDAGAVEGEGPPAGPLTLLVDSVADLPDAHPGDGTCDVGDGSCTLRAAIDEANAWPGEDTISLSPGVDPVLSLPGVDDTNAAGDLDVNDALVLEGSGAIVDGGGIDRILHVRAPVTVRDTTLTGGLTNGDGGAVLVERVGGSLVLERSTVSGNEAVGGGGGIRVEGSATVVASTVSGNRAARGGGLSTQASNLSIQRSTVVANRASLGAAVEVGLTGNVTATMSVLDGSGPACNRTMASGGYNLDASGTCVNASGTDRTGPAKIGPLAHNGGLTATHLPYADSPVLDAIPCIGQTIDQRGVARPAGAGCDIGAVEGAAPGAAPEPIFVVDTALDGADAAPGDGTCAAVGGGCTLRAAVDEANTSTVVTTVRIAPGIDPVLTTPGIEDANASGDIDVHAHVTFEGAGATLDANQLDRALDVGGSSVVLRDLTVVRGVAASGGGGGIRLTEGTHTLESVAVMDSSAPASQAGGGGISVRVATVALTDVTLASNSASSAGGGLRVEQSTVAVTDGAILDNVTNFVGGGVGAADSTVVLDGVAIEGNHAASSGGGVEIRGTGSMHLDGTRVAANTATVGGGGLDASSSGVAEVTVSDSTFADNAVDGTSVGGGAVKARGRLTVEGSTFVGNTATGSVAAWGGALQTVAATATVRIEGSTFVGNRAIGPNANGGHTIASSSTSTTLVRSSVVNTAGGPGIELVAPSGSFVIAGVALESSGVACGAGLTSGGYNVTSDASCPTAVGDLPSSVLGLGALADNGGPTHTVMPPVGSPVVDAIPPGTAGLCDATVPADQRGLARPVGAGCDAGAVERQPSDP